MQIYYGYYGRETILLPFVTKGLFSGLILVVVSNICSLHPYVDWFGEDSRFDFSDQPVMLVSGRVPQRSLPFKLFMDLLPFADYRSLKEARDLSLFGLSSSFITTLHGKSHSTSTFFRKKRGNKVVVMMVCDDVVIFCFHLMFALYLKVCLFILIFNC